MLIDTSFDFRVDARGKDPDSHSPTLRTYAARATPDSPARDPARPAREVLLPWVHRPHRDGDDARPLGHWLTEAADLITARVDELAVTAARHRPPWMLPLGQPPADPEAERQWLRHVAVIAAYRDQHTITSDDPRQVLGPYPESGRAGHKAYWHAAESVLAARRLAGLDAPAVAATAEAHARAHVAADIYRALPDDERIAITTEMAAKLGPLWFGHPTEPDQDAATQPVHAATLTSTLSVHSHMTTAPEPARREPAAHEPVEAALARRGPTRRPIAARQTTGSEPNPVRQQDHLIRPQQPTQADRQHRL
jgi:hypothetical protein